MKLKGRDIGNHDEMKAHSAELRKGSDNAASKEAVEAELEHAVFFFLGLAVG